MSKNILSSSHGKPALSPEALSEDANVVLHHTVIRELHDQGDKLAEESNKMHQVAEDLQRNLTASDGEVSSKLYWKTIAGVQEEVEYIHQKYAGLAQKAGVFNTKDFETYTGYEEYQSKVALAADTITHQGMRFVHPCPMHEVEAKVLFRKTYKCGVCQQELVMDMKGEDSSIRHPGQSRICYHFWVFLVVYILIVGVFLSTR
ncbi:hypothetical protein UCRPC4_g05823 [Phaeomoniella chlamydospora]|uniref:Uncharacterized protein n=1 Tax=Phaeomoniella chlamydospora TaxID=158046 RepID=A0A0G2GIU6_PHACM|nr:hypothetical protein UCRPC4_g05823 [Phaeomoniella chlamydospora]